MVGGSPSFSESETVLLVSILGLKITNNDTSLVVTLTVHLEGLYILSESRIPSCLYKTYDTVRSSGLDFKLDATNGVVLR